VKDSVSGSPTRVTIVNVGYRGVNAWVVGSGGSRIIVDLGWPGGMGQLLANLKRMDVPLHEIRYALATHYHIDHAGCAQDLKRAGVPLLVLQTQAAWIADMKRFTKPQDNYTEITLHDNVNITFAESRERLARIGIAGEIVPTPGHSDDSVSLVLDSGEAFTGDLAHPQMAGDDALETVKTSWRRLRDRGAVTIYPGHGGVRSIFSALAE
jgi:glyoxylase-like metal-dependent hydrolase (beta-lactamase superfamily II)